jgi:hypothetical protein
MNYPHAHIDDSFGEPKKSQSSIISNGFWWFLRLGHLIPIVACIGGPKKMGANMGTNFPRCQKTWFFDIFFAAYPHGYARFRGTTSKRVRLGIHQKKMPIFFWVPTYFLENLSLFLTEKTQPFSQSPEKTGSGQAPGNEKKKLIRIYYILIKFFFRFRGFLWDRFFAVKIVVVVVVEEARIFPAKKDDGFCGKDVGTQNKMASFSMDPQSRVFLGGPPKTHASIPRG